MVLQIELTQEEQAALQRKAAVKGQTVEEVAHSAVVEYVFEKRQPSVEQMLAWVNQAAGMWADYDDLPDLADMRRQAERDWLFDDGSDSTH